MYCKKNQLELSLRSSKNLELVSGELPTVIVTHTVIHLHICLISPAA